MQNSSSCNKCIKTIDVIPCRCVCSINNTELTLNGVSKTNNCCNCNINPCVMFDCLDVEQIANNMILVRAKCNIKY